MKGLRVGHFTNEERGTGISVFLFDKPGVGAYCLCGASPATHELGTIEVEAHVTHIDGLVFTGGSAFGLPAVSDVLRWFHEQKRGWPTPHTFVPIVPVAAIYDLGVKLPLPPTEAEAYEACLSAEVDNMASGRIGAGTGASVGKLMASAAPMTGGIGCAKITLKNGVVVLAYVVVNCVGDVRDKSGQIIAGARLPNGEFADCERQLLAGYSEQAILSANTTLAAVFTNAKFSKIELKRIAKMAVAGLARGISPIFTRYDGDIVFCVSLGELTASEMAVGTMAAEVIQQAIINAVADSVVVE